MVMKTGDYCKKKKVEMQDDLMLENLPLKDFLLSYINTQKSAVSERDEDVFRRGKR